MCKAKPACGRPGIHSGFQNVTFDESCETPQGKYRTGVMRFPIPRLSRAGAPGSDCRIQCKAPFTHLMTHITRLTDWLKEIAANPPRHCRCGGGGQGEPSLGAW